MNDLNLSGCSQFKRLPEFVESMEHLSVLSLKGTAISNTNKVLYKIKQKINMILYIHKILLLARGFFEVKLKANPRRLNLSLIFIGDSRSHWQHFL